MTSEMYNFGPHKSLRLGAFYGFDVSEKYRAADKNLRSKSTPPMLPPIDTGRSTTEEVKSKRKRHDSSFKLPDQIDTANGSFGRKMGFGPARKKAFPRPLPLYSKHIKTNPSQLKKLESKEKESISTTLRELPNIYETEFVGNRSLKAEVKNGTKESESKGINLKELDLAQDIRERIQQFKKWQRNQEKKLKRVPGKHIDSNDFSERERNIHTLKLSSIFRNEQENHEEQHISRTLNLGEMIKQEKVAIDDGIVHRAEVTQKGYENDYYPMSTCCSWRTGSPPAPLPDGFLLDRERTVITWKTWRNVNESYAYCDVNKYIEDNELLPDEKEKRIYQWIDDVFNATINASQ